MSAQPLPNDNALGSRQSLQYGCYTIYAFAMTTVCLRLYTRLRFIHSLGWDDYFVIIAAFGSTAVIITVPFAFGFGIGLHEVVLTQDQILNAIKVAWITGIFYPFSIACAKCSIVCLYLRLSSTPLHRKVLYALGGLIIAQGVGGAIAVALDCNPIDVIWDSSLPVHCQKSVLALKYFNGIWSIISDVILAILPIPVLKQLQLSHRKKVSLVILFGSGLIVIGVTAARQVLISISFSRDFTWEWAWTALLTNLDINLSIICVCVPALQTFVRQITCHSDSSSCGYSTKIPSHPTKANPAPIRDCGRRSRAQQNLQSASTEQIIFQCPGEDRENIAGSQDQWGHIGDNSGHLVKTVITSGPRPEETDVIQLQEIGHNGVIKSVETFVEYGEAR